MSNLEESILEEITEAIQSDRLVLPTLPEVALKARETAEDPNVSCAELSKVVGNDAALSARIIKVANSPLMRARNPITDLQMAINRLGIQFTSNLITGLAMQQMFQATTDSVDKKMREVWACSTEVAGIAHVLCRHYTRLQADQATLAGLVHEIGILPILTFAEDNPLLLRDSITLNSVIDKIHPRVGTIILKTWDFNEELISVPEGYLQFDRDKDVKPDYVDIITVAYLQSLTGSEHEHATLDWSSIPAFKKLGLDTDEDLMGAEDVSADMEAAMAMLNG